MFILLFLTGSLALFLFALKQNQKGYIEMARICSTCNHGMEYHLKSPTAGTTCNKYGCPCPDIPVTGDQD